MSNTISLTQIEQAPDWKQRAASYRMNVLRFFAEQLGKRITANEFRARPEVFGYAFRNRISELATMGCVFKDATRNKNGTWKLGTWEDGDYGYTLIHCPEKLGSLPDYCAQKEIPWDKRPRVTGLELFDATVRR